jgi:hypothetical protein
MIQQTYTGSNNQTIAPLVMGVAHRVDVACFQVPPIDKASCGISHSSRKVRFGNSVCTAIPKWNSLVIDERTEYCRGDNNNVIATDIPRRGQMITRIIIDYHYINTQSGETTARKLNWQKVIPQGITVLAGYFNDHTIQWDSRCQVQQNAVFCDDMIDKNSLQSGDNDKATHDYTKKNHEGQSIIKLTLAHCLFTEWFILADDYATVSNYKVIQWKVGADRHEDISKM